MSKSFGRGRLLVWSALIFLMQGCLLVAWGQMIPIQNPSFELGLDSPEGWQLSGGEGDWTEEAAAGVRAVSVTGTENSQASTYWYTEPLAFEADACYRLCFQARRVSGSGGSPITGPSFCNRDLHEVTSDWEQYSSYFVAPSSGAAASVRLGQWNAGGVIAFDDVSLVRAEPVYRHSNGIVLGDGEHIAGNQYVFTASFTGESANHARTLQGYDCFFNKPRWVFSPGNWVTYYHEVNAVAQTSAEIEVTIGHHTGGTLVAEASVDGNTWLEVGMIDGLGTLNAVIPASLFPATSVMIRFTVKPSEQSDAPIYLQLYGYSYRATLEHAPGDCQGATRFIAVPESDGKVRVNFEGIEESAPGGGTVLRFLATNLSPESVTITPRLRVGANNTATCETSIEAITLAVNSSNGVPIVLPYEIPGAGDISLVLDLGEEVVYRAETGFNVSCLFETGYGEVLPDSSESVGLWWASSGWKISRSRSVPQKASAAMRIKLAQNEREAAQFVLRPSESLHNLRVTSQTLRSDDGASLPVEAIEVLRVGYVPVSQPTDAVGVAAPWPDPLPPIEDAIDLAANENQPFWLCVHSTAATPAGIYKGSILLEAEGWRASVPVEVEVFDFALPDRKSCVSAFGFDASLAFRYHNVRTEDDRRAVYEKYLSILSDHHISIYNPAFLDPIQYSWPRLTKWKGGERNETERYSGNESLLLRDESKTANVGALYDALLSIPDEGLHIAFNYKTAEPGHSFLVTLLHYDGAGVWQHGRNNNIAIEGDGSWQRFETVVNTFPDGAQQFMLRLWATRYSEAGTATGTVWIDDIEVRAADGGTVLLQDGFEPLDADAAAALFVPEFDWTAWDAAMTRAFEQYHFNGFSLPVPGMGGGTFHARYEPSLLGYGEDTEEYKAAFTAWCRAVETHLREKGWLEDAYVYWFDEPAPDDYEFVMNGFRKLKEAAPDIGRMLTEQIEPKMIGGPNIWCPLSNLYDYDMARERQAAGEKIWWYVCTGPKAPYATLFIDHPATELRVWLWQTWERAIDGILIWQSNYWHSAAAYPDAPQNPYEDPMGWTSGYSTPAGTKRPWGNGDGRFIYPPLAAADGQPEAPVFDDPVSSIRLEMLRDGIEDYEYCVILRDLLKQDEGKLSDADMAKYQRLLEVPDEISKSMTEFTLDPAPIEAHREAVGRAITLLNAPQE